MAKFPNVKVKLSGEDGNSMMIIGRVRRAMMTAKLPKEELDAFTEKVISGDYDNVLRTCMEYVEVE